MRGPNCISLKVGDEVMVRRVGAYRREATITHERVSKVGRDYLYTQPIEGQTTHATRFQRTDGDGTHCNGDPNGNLPKQIVTREWLDLEARARIAEAWFRNLYYRIDATSFTVEALETAVAALEAGKIR